MSVGGYTHGGVRAHECRYLWGVIHVAGYMHMSAGILVGQSCWISLEVELQTVVSCLIGCWKLKLGPLQDGLGNYQVLMFARQAFYQLNRFLVPHRLLFLF